MHKLKQDLDRVGYGRLPGLNWTDAGVEIEHLGLIAERLRKRGVPPVFLFMFDQAWMVWERLFAAMSVAMESDEVSSPNGHCSTIPNIPCLVQSL